MKKLMYLFVTGLIFIFIACGGGEASTENGNKNQDVIIVCGDDCEKACCLGCKATEGAKKCIVLVDGSMPCCVTEEPSSEE